MFSFDSDFIYEDKCIRVLDVIDDISLMVKNKDVKTFGREIINLIVGILQIICLQRLYKEAADKEKDDVNTMDGKEIMRRDEIESFQQKMFLIKLYRSVFELNDDEHLTRCIYGLRFIINFHIYFHFTQLHWLLNTKFKNHVSNGSNCCITHFRYMRKILSSEKNCSIQSNKNFSN